MSKNKKEPVSPETLGLPPGGADSHAHLTSPPLWPQFEEVVERARRAGVTTIGQIFLNHTVYAERIDVMAAKPGLFFCLGVHPSDGLKFTEEEYDRQEKAFLNDDRLRAVGEIGLDFYRESCPAELQYTIFRRQLATARRLDRPVVIHSRDAFEDTIRVLDEEGFSGAPLLWHCFGGDTAQAEALLKRGWHISIPGPVTYPANVALREALAVIPTDRLHVETDCPYLAPQEWRGKTNEPALCAFTAVAVAHAKSMDPAELWTICGDNTRRFFGVDTL